MVDVLDSFRSIVGDDHVLIDDDLRRGFEVDWTGRFGGESIAIVRPASTAEVAALLAVCVEHGVAVVPQGGNTGLVGGSVPRPGGRRPTIVLATTRLTDLGPVDTEAMQVTAGAGVTLAAWRAHARSADLDTPVDFAARDTATIGGAIATNAGGSRVLRFGTMRSQVVGVEAVLADGSIVGSLAGLPKETAGIHWPSLLAGSEGTLAIVTRARLRLVPRFAHTASALVSTPSPAAAVRLLGTLRRGVPALDAVELILPTALQLVAGHLGRAAPVTVDRDGCAVLIDCAAHADPSDELATALRAADTEGLVADSAFASSGPRRDELLALRDRLTEAIATAATPLGTPTHKLDVAVPVGALGELLTVARRAAEDDGATLYAFGHLAEGNLHLNFLGATDTRAIADVVLPAVARLGGTISAEHGIGVAKRDWLHLVRAPADLAAQAALRRALDPGAILNPGVLAAPPPGR